MSLEAAEAVAAMIAERQKAREAEYAQRTARQTADIAEHLERRRHGLERRHALKLARSQPNPSIT